MKGLKIDRSTSVLTIVFIIAVSIVFFLLAITYKQLEKLSNNTALVTNSLEASLKIEEIYKDLKDIEVERRNSIILQDRNSRFVIENKIRTINRTYVELNRLYIGNNTQTENLSQLALLIKEKIKLSNKLLTDNFNYNDRIYVQKSLEEGNAVMKQIHNKIEEMLQIERYNLNSNKNQFIFLEKSTPLYIYLFSSVSLIILCIAFYRIYNTSLKQKNINRSLAFTQQINNQAEYIGDFGIWTYNIKNKKFSYSDNAYRLFGYDPQDNEDKKKFDFLSHIHPDDRQFAFHRNKLMLNNQEYIPYTIRINTKAGETKYIKTNRKKVFDTAGNEFILGITTDITEEVKNKEILYKSNRENHFYTTMSKEAEIIGEYGFWRFFIADNQYVFSDNVRKLIGFDETMKLDSVFDLLPHVHPEDIDQAANVVERMYGLEEDIAPFTVRVIKYDTKKLNYFRISNKLLKGDEGTTPHYLVFAVDITDDIENKDNIKEQNRALELQNKELMAFNYVASHDLQEPLRKIETFLSRLKEKDYEILSSSGKQYMDRVMSSADRMRTLINDLLEFSRSTKSDHSFENKDLNVLLKNSLEALNSLIEEKDATIFYNELPTLKVIPFQIQQLFINLIGNSLKYSKPEKNPIINIQSSIIDSEFIQINQKLTETKYYQFIFEDNGIGFENKYNTKIFDLFNRLHTREEYEGTGIGLAICKKIVENHHGFITAKGEIGKGSTFTIYLPYKL